MWTLIILNVVGTIEERIIRFKSKKSKEAEKRRESREIEKSKKVDSDDLDRLKWASATRFFLLFVSTAATGGGRRHGSTVQRLLLWITFCPK